MLTKQQSEIALARGWDEVTLDLVNDYPGKVSYQSSHLMILDNKLHVYRMLGPQRVLTNLGITEATGWADGSGTNSRRVAGIGVVIESSCIPEPRLIHHNIGLGSNNTAELMAIWRVLMEIPRNDAKIIIRSDSAYSIGILTNLDWEVKANQELVWAIRDDLSFRPNVTINHVRGHEGTYYQEMADALAGVARKYAPQTLFF